MYREIKGNKVSSGALCKEVKSFRSDWRRFLKLEEIEPRHVRNNKRQQKRIERFKEKKKKDKLAKEEEKKNAENNQRRITLVSSIGMEERDVVGDGNCQFRALSNQLYDDENHYNYIRQQVIEELRAHPERYRRFAEAEAGISYEEYLTSMASDQHWGDGITLAAFSGLCMSGLLGPNILSIYRFRSLFNSRLLTLPIGDAY